VLTKKALRDLWRSSSFRPIKRYGQNFLVDQNVRDKIIQTVAPCADDNILEIGPGFGELTEPLALKSGRVTVVEKDRRLAAALNGDLLTGIENVTVVEGDILEFEIGTDFTKIVGNLPYYITTPILEKIFDLDSIPDTFIMVQKEYGQRMTAGPGEEDYSSLSCFVRLNAEVEQVLSINRGCFYPEPKIDSVFLKLTPRKSSAVQVSDRKVLHSVIRSAFGQRRKTLRASLVGQGLLNMTKEDAGSMLENIGLSRNARPEEVDLEGFARIADRIVEFRKDK